MAVYDSKVLNGEHLSYLISLIKTALNGKQATIDSSHKLATNLINTGNDAGFVSSTEKSSWNGKQDALVFNTAYNASSNKVATMADIPSVSGFQTASDVSSAISSAISGLTTFRFEIVQALPQSNQDSNAIYLLPKSTSSTNDIYEEWIWVKTGTENNQDVYGWEHIGNTQIDVSALSNTEIQTIWDGVV